MSLTVDAPFDLTACDKERIHEIHYIQGHGAFLAISSLGLKIRNISENAGQFFEIEGSVEGLIGRKLNEILSMNLSKQIQDKIRKIDLVSQKSYYFQCQDKKLLDIYLYKIDDDLYGLEFSEILVGPEVENPERIMNEYLQQMQMTKNLVDLSQIACKAVRKFSGFDRVMIYRFFAPNMDGEVIGEDRVAHAHSYLHHRFPATDIPKPARDLYFRNQIRFIYDSMEETSDIFPKFNALRKPLDLSDSRLRGVSRIHIEYLKNMKVRASFSVAIIVENQLWGIISCHHATPLYVSHLARSQCFTIANALALSAPMIEKMNQQNKELAFNRNLHRLFAQLKLSESPLNELFKQGGEMNSLFASTGFALVSSKKTDLYGMTPLSRDLKPIWKWVLERMESEGKSVFSTNSLMSLAPIFEDFKDLVSGVLAIRLSELGDSVLMMFRPEYLQTIQWGGDPRKNIEARNYQGTINPRASFDTFSEVIKHTSLPWENFELIGGEIFKSLIFDSLINKEELIAELTQRLAAKKS